MAKLKRFITEVDVLHVPKGTAVTHEVKPGNIGKTGKLLCSVGTGNLFFAKDELEEVTK